MLICFEEFLERLTVLRFCGVDLLECGIRHTWGLISGP
jgi:hypothetical protein